MTTATLALAETMTLVSRTADFALVLDSDDECDGYPYEVLDADGEVIDSQDTLNRGRVALRLAQDEVDEEARQERLGDLRGEIALAMEDVDDEATLAAILAMLKR